MQRNLGGLCKVRCTDQADDSCESGRLSALEDIYKRFVPSAGAIRRDLYTVIILQISGFLHPTLKNVRNMF